MKRYIYSYAKTDWRKFNDFLTEVNWYNLLQNKSIDNAWRAFHDALQTGIQKFTPRRLIKPDYHKKWFSPSLLPLLNQKKAAWNNLRTHSTPAAWRHYKFARNTFNRALRRQKWEHAKSTAAEINEARFNPRLFWRLANSQLCRGKSDASPSLIINDKPSADPKIIAAEFNRCFASKCSVGDPTRQLPAFGSRTGAKLANIKFKACTVYKMLKDLDPSTATGPDDIPASVLKNCAAAIASPLAELFHRSFRAGVVPCGWKRANVTPVHKKGSKSEISNYRPISLLPIVSKIMEKIINDKLVRYLEINNLLHPSQFGFRKQRSTMQALLTITQAAEDALDAGEEYRIVSLDIMNGSLFRSSVQRINAMVTFARCPFTHTMDFILSATCKSAVFIILVFLFLVFRNFYQFCYFGLQANCMFEFSLISNYS